MDPTYTGIFIAAVIVAIVGHCFEGKGISPAEKLFQSIKWMGLIVIALYILIIVAALTDGLGDIPLLGGGYVWVRGHWRRR